MLKHLVLSCCPPPVYRTARRLVRRYRKWRFDRLPKLTEAEVQRILAEDLGARSGATLFVHSAVDKMNLAFPFYRLLGILRECVGDEGTLLFPCTHLLGRAEEELRLRDTFDVRKARTSMGIVPELARRQADACRSLHPTNSIVALGKHARELTQDHHTSIYPCGEKSPYYKIVRHDGLIVGLGVSTESLTFVHCVEQVSKDRFPVKTLNDEIYEAPVVDKEGRPGVVRTLSPSKRIQLRNVPAYVRRHIPADVCRDFLVHGVHFFVARSRPLYALMEELAGKKITIYSTVF